MKKGQLGKVALLALVIALTFAGLKPGHATPTYKGRDREAEWRQKALERIEQIRKGELAVEVVDGRGNPVPGAEVKVTMQRHAFGFGSAVTSHDMTADTADGRRYREEVARLFNKIVLENDLKWSSWEQGKKKIPGDFYNIDSVMATLQWVREHGMQARGVYGAWGPLASDRGTTWNAERQGQNFRNALLQHAEEKVRRVGPLVSEWDVVNHPVGWGPKTIREIAGSDIYELMFQKFREWNPGTVRYINEGNILCNYGSHPANSAYLHLIEEMVGKGVPVQGIGFMGHFFAEKDLTPPKKLLEILDQYAVFGLPLQVTEFDVRFGNAGQFLTLSAEQERLQADYTRDFLIATFSHPSVVGVMIWGFWEGRHWYPSAAMFRRDWSVKPNGRVWEELVLKEWWTAAGGVTDGTGRFVTRGFLGDYLVEATYQGRKGRSEGITLSRAGTLTRIVLR